MCAVSGDYVPLQQTLCEKVVNCGCASLYNLGDLSTKMHAALMYLRGCADCVAAQTIGREECDDMVLRDCVKAQVKRVRTEYVRVHGCSSNLSGGANKLAKQIAMMTVGLPQLGEADDDGGHFFATSRASRSSGVSSSATTANASNIPSTVNFLLRERRLFSSTWMPCTSCCALED